MSTVSPLQPALPFSAAPTVLPIACAPIKLPQSVDKGLKTASDIMQKMQRTAQAGFAHLQRNIDAISLEPIFRFVNKHATDVEKVFNVVSCLPVLGVIGSVARSFVAKIQLITGVAIAALAEIGLMFENGKEGESPLRAKWQLLSKFGMEQTLHGCLNILRAEAEILLSTFTMGLGNVVLLGPNVCNHREFNPFFSYGTLVNAKNISTESVKDIPVVNASAASIPAETV